MVTISQPKVRIYLRTVKDLFDALEKNGLDHLRGSWFNTDSNGVVRGACALGQIAVNAGVASTSLPTRSQGFFKKYDAGQIIVLAKDEATLEAARASQAAGHELSVVGQLDRFPVKTGTRWSGQGNVGHTIMHFNDAQEYIGSKQVYTLRTYEEVVAMAREVMEPYFAEPVYLVQEERKASGTLKVSAAPAPAPEPKVGDYVWHIHHEILVEKLSEPIGNRVKAIQGKNKAEIPTRLRLMKPVRGTLSSDAKKALNGTLFGSEARATAQKEIDALHQKECPGCPWNGRTIFPVKVKSGW